MYLRIRIQGRITDNLSPDIYSYKPPMSNYNVILSFHPHLKQKGRKDKTETKDTCIQHQKFQQGKIQKKHL